MQCWDIFTFRPKTIEAFPIQNIFAGQNAVGYDYAFYKALRDADLDVSSSWTQLKKKEKKKLQESLMRELSNEVPVIIDPRGRVFAVDQHHDMFALISLLGKDANAFVPLRVLRDFSVENISEIEFTQAVKANGWIYEKNLDDVFGNPVRIWELSNSVERSVVGMAFLEITRSKDIPLKGRYFSPFVQFLLADFVTQNSLASFGKEYDRSNAEAIVALIKQNSAVRTFLRGHLSEGAPKELKEFLED